MPGGIFQFAKHLPIIIGLASAGKGKASKARKQTYLQKRSEMKRMLAVLAMTALMVAMMAMPASAQPVVTGGLVNVEIGDVTVTVPVQVAANICANVDLALAEQFAETGQTLECDVRASQRL